VPKRISLVFTLLLATVMLIRPASASTLALSNWHANGSQMWRINFPGYNNAMPANQKTDLGVSELTYPQSGTYASVTYDIPLSSSHKISLDAGTLGAFSSATGTDSDWDYSRSKELWHYGTFQTDGTSTFINLDFKHMLANNTEFFYGYGYSNSQYVMTQGYYSVLDYAAVDLPLPTLHSTYSIAYHGPHVGLTGTKQLAPKLALVGSFSYSPLVLVQGHGIWNLRNLDFRHFGTGQMLDGKIALHYAIAGRRDNALILGYRYQYYSLYTGSENTSNQITWTKATKLQHGWYMGGEFSF